jgi:cyclic pyranopterin phosphate synthase
VTDLSHFDGAGNAIMVDVGGKAETLRTAVAKGTVSMAPATFERIAGRTIDKGDVLAVARLAGIMAAKRTADLIPLCHPLPLDAVEVNFTLLAEDHAVEIEASCRVTGRTGVEMEAMTAVSIAALTLYDMCKAIDRGMTIGAIRLVHKSGGRSGAWSSS